MIKKIFILIVFICIFTGKVFAMDFSGDMEVISPLLGNPEMQAYSLEVGKKIIKNFIMPSTDDNLATLVTFKVDKNGKLISYEITQTSGNEDYDKRVIDAIQKSSPYPPPGFQDGEEVGVVLNMDLNILKLIKMLEDANLDFDFNSDFVPENMEEILKPSTQPAQQETKPVQPAGHAQPETKPTSPSNPEIEIIKKQPAGKKFINPYEIQKSLE